MSMGGQLEPFVRHGTDEERIEVPADDILDAIAEGRDIDVEYAIIDGDLNVIMIADLLEEDENGMRKVDGRVSLLSSILDGGVTFTSTIFDKEVNFSSTIFNGNVNFPSAAFSERASFSFATFNGSASFLSATFSKAAIFRSATFCEAANFGGTVFGSNVSFWLAVFNKAVLFWEATFNEATDFNGAVLSQPASFVGVDFRENTVFVGLWNDILCPTIRFITRGRVELTEKVVTDFSSLDTSTVMDGSSNPHLKRYIDDEQWIKSWRERSNRRRFVFFIWEITSHCGRSIAMWAAWSLFFILLFTFAYTPVPDWAPEWWRDFWQEHGAAFEQTVSTYRGKPMNFWSCFYFSIVSFTTLGFGDIAAANSLARFLVTAQVTFGYVMLGGLISIFANKFARRS